GPTELHVHLSILQGFHINANKTSSNEPLIPTSLTVTEPADGATVEYPPGEEQRFAFAERAIRVHSGEVTMVVRFREPPRAGSVVRMGLSYQACDEDSCLPPVTKQVGVGVPG